MRTVGLVRCSSTLAMRTALDAIISDAAIAISLALQFGCPLNTIRHALKRDSQGIAASPIGAALDLIL